MRLQHKLLLLPAFLFAAALHAQKELPTETVDVVKDFEVRLMESSKIDVLPSLPKLDTTTKPQNYLVPARPLAVTYEAPKMRPIAMRAVKKEEIYNGFAKLGGGVPTSLWGEAGYGFAAKEKFDGKVWFRHHSLNATKAVENQRMFNNDALVSGNIYLQNNLAVEAKVGYSYDRVHFYGYNDDSLSFEPEAVRQDFKILDIGGRVYNSKRTESDLNYSVAPKLYVLNDFYGNKETGFDLNLTASKWFAEKHPLRLTIRTDFTKFTDTVSQSLNNIYLQPSFTFHADFIKLKIGGNFASNRDVFSIFPDCELTLRVFGDGIQIFAGATGDLRKNTYRSMTEYNPYLQIRNSEIANTRFDNYFGGVKGNLGWIEYNGQIGYSKASNLALYQTTFTTEGITRFRPVYDTVKIVSLQGTITLKPIKNLVLQGTYNQSVFTTTNELTAWGIPEIEGNFTGTYTLLDGKANVNAGLYLADRISRFDENGRPGKDNALVDLNIGGNYYFSKNIGAFLSINNLLNNRRERWYQYPIVGTNFMAGITARF